MSAIIALFGTALFDAARYDTAALELSLSLLARAAEGGPVTLAIDEGTLSLNGAAVTPECPGEALVAGALRAHETLRIQLPGGLEPRHWREVTQAYASPPGTFASPIKLRDALRASLPHLELWVLDPGNRGDARNGAPADRTATASPVTTRAGDLSGFSTELARLQTDGRAAAERRDASEVARIILRLAELERSEASGQAAIVMKERRRVVTPAILEWLVGEASQTRTPRNVSDALLTLGDEIIEPVLEEVARGGTTPASREMLAALMARVPGLEGHLTRALRGTIPSLAHGAAIVAGRRHLEGAVPALALLMRHQDTAVRAAAWRALEEIGTREAIDALSTRNR